MKYPFLVVLLMFFHWQVWAASPSLRFDEITLKDGLSQATVIDILQDSQGFMWFATQDGLNRYDGYEFVVYRHDQENPNSLSENYVNSVFQDTRGVIWIATRNGLNQFDPATNQFVQYYHDIHNPNSLSDNWVFGIAEDLYGRIWVGTYDAGVNIYDPTTKEFTTLMHDPDNPNSLSDNGVYDIHVDSSGTVWVATRGGGVNRYNTQNQMFTRFTHDSADPHSIGHDRIYRIFEDSETNLWFATRGGGLNRFQSESENFISYQHDLKNPNSISGDQVYCIGEDLNGDLIIGTMFEGLNRFDKKTAKFSRIRHDPTVRTSISGDSVLACMVDASGILWLSIQDVGLNRVNQQGAVFNHHYHIPSDPLSLSDNSIQAFVETREGRIYVGTRRGGINYFDPVTDQFKVIHDVNNPQHAVLGKSSSHIIEGDNGYLWIALQDEGLVKFNPQTGDIVHFVHDPKDPSSISDNSLLYILPDGFGQLWIATINGLNLFDPTTGTSKVYYHDDEDTSTLASNWVTSLLLDHSGRLWVGTQSGVDILDAQTDTFSHLKHDPLNSESLSGNSVLSLYEDSRMDIWVSTASGLSTYLPKTGTFSRIQKEQGLSNVQTYGVLEDNDGQLWIMTNFGLNRYDLETGEIRLFTEEDGLQGNEFNEGAIYKLKDGRLMFGGVKGFNIFEPRLIHDNPFPPKVMITNFRILNQNVQIRRDGVVHEERVVLNKAINYIERINLNHEDSVFSFEFSAMHYAAPNLNRYAYRLIGFDGDWIYTDYKNRRATYTNLAAGEYTFEVKAANKDNVWSESPVSVKVVINFPWWLSTGAKFLWLIVFFLGSFAIFHLKTDRIRKQREQLQQQVTWQVAQVVAQKKALETSYEDIRIISDVGQKINASLDMDKVLWAVYEAINKLMDGTVFGIGLYMREKNQIRVELAMEKGKRYKPYYRSMENKNQFPVWCIENDADIFVNDIDEDSHKYLKVHEYEDGETKPPVFLDDGAYSGAPQSLIYVPIKSEDKILGYMTVQSFNKHAYRSVHVDILHTLAAYTSTAIVNSRAHQQLLDNKKLQVESEKMASLGALVARMAHEIDTPVGNCLTMASSLEFEADQVFSAKRQGKLTSAKFNQFEEKMNQCLSLLMNNLHKTTSLIANFEGVVVDLATEVKHTFDLKQFLIKTVQTLHSELADNDVKLDLICDDELMITTYTSPLMRVMTTLVMNTLMHAFDEHILDRRITITVTAVGDEAHIRYADNGMGMEESSASRIFDPFYTTKRCDGCLGLGMHIVYNQVSQGLNGTVSCQSAAGQGMKIFIIMPMKNQS